MVVLVVAPGLDGNINVQVDVTFKKAPKVPPKVAVPQRFAFDETLTPAKARLPKRATMAKAKLERRRSRKRQKKTG